MKDVDTMIGLFDRLVDAGSTVIVVEHNLDVVSRTDWVIDLGPGVGHDGGKVVFEGPPAQLLRHKSSLTGKFLAAAAAKSGPDLPALPPVARCCYRAAQFHDICPRPSPSTSLILK
jgi:ABC-type multidrug transport system ATPase subunit